MDHFPIVLALIRAATRERNPAVLQHADRLREALVARGDAEEADALALAIAGNQKPNSAKLSPARVVASRAIFAGELMTSNTAPPMDKETSAPLAEVWPIEKLENL